MNRQVEVLVPPETTALTTVERLLLESIIFAGADPDLLEAKILEASSDIALRVAPTLGSETVLETIWADYPDCWSPWLNLSVWPVSEITSVTVDGTVIDTSQYRLDSELRRLRFYTPTGGAFGWPYGWSSVQSIAIEYTGGYLLPGQMDRNLPPSLEGACIDLVSSYWHSRGRDPTLRGETNVGVYEFTYWTGAIGEAGDLPPQVEAKIYPFKCKPFIW